MTFFKYIKLNNGENIIVKTPDSCENFTSKNYIEILDPVVVISIKMPKNNYIFETFVMQPWLKPAKEGIIFLPSNSVLVMADLDESVVDQYLEFIQEVRYNTTRKTHQPVMEASEAELGMECIAVDECDDELEVNDVVELDEYINDIMERVQHVRKKTVH